MDHDTPLQDAQNAQASISSQDPSKTAPNSRADKWNAHKDEIYKVYIQQNNTLETTMQRIEGQGGPIASIRTWKSKLKDWTYEKNLTSNDMNIISAKAKKRKNEDGKETVFYHWDSEISFERIERFRKAPKTSRMASPGAQTPPNIRYHTPTVEHQTTSIETQGNHYSKSILALDFLPSTELEAIPADHSILEADDVALYELDTMVIAGNETAKNFAADLQVTNVSVNQQQFLHFMSDGVPRLSPHPSLQPFSDRGSPPNFNESWMIQDFDELFMNSGINWNQDSRGPSPIRMLDTFLSENFSAEESQAAFSISARSSSSWALNDIPWFRFQELIKTTGSLGYNLQMNQVFHSSTLNSNMHLTFLDLARGDVELNERCRLLSTLFRSPPGSINQKILPEFSSKLQELIPENSDGEIRSKLQQLFHPSNKSPLHELTEFASYFLSNNTLSEERTDEFLEWAIEKRPKELFRSLFAIETPTVDAFSERILESVARTGNASILQLLIDCGLDVRYLAGISGGRYLQLSLYHGSVDVAHLLLDNGADVNPPLGESLYDSPPLHQATLEGYDEITSRLLEAGAEVDTTFENCTALSYAILDGSADIVRLLLQAGADVDTGEIDECENLDWAYLHKRNIYYIILPMSRKAKTSLTISGILSAANRGKQALSQYIDGHKGKNTRIVEEKLELSLWTAIAEKQSTATISVLLEFGVDPNTETVDTSQPPLVLAAMHYDIDLAERLLNAGARIDTPGVLEEVAQSEDGFDTMNFLIEQGVDVIASGGAALRRAISGNNLGGVKLLMESGVKINDASLCADGYTYLAKAARCAEIKTVKHLVDNGAIVNAPPSTIRGITALQAGARAGNLEMVKFLLDIGSDVNAEPSSSNGTTALEASVDVYKLKEEHAAIFQLLLDKGADINGPRGQRRSKKWNSALVSLIAKSAISQLIQRALNAGADINRRGKGEGARTPLQAAAEVGNLELVKQLLEKGAKINAQPSANYGRTALQAACSGENPKLELTQYLLKEGAEVNAAAGIKRGLTALQGAAIQGHIKIALVLLDAGAEVNAEPAEIKGRMALDGAAEHGRLDMVQFLLNFGAKSNVSGDTGFDTAIKFARKNGYFAVAKLLEARSTS